MEVPRVGVAETEDAAGVGCEVLSVGVDALPNNGTIIWQFPIIETVLRHKGFSCLVPNKRVM